MVRKPAPRLHNSKTNWDTYRRIIQDKINLSIKFKECEDVGLDVQLTKYSVYPSMLPKKLHQTAIPKEKLIIYPTKLRVVAEKRKARSTWQRTLTPDSRRIFNRISNKLKSKLQEMRNESFKKYVSNLKREVNSIWKPIKHRGKPKTTSPAIRKYSTPPGPWAKSDKEEAQIFAEHLSEFFGSHNNDADQEVERDLTTPTESQERLQAFTLKEIKK